MIKQETYIFEQITRNWAGIAMLFPINTKYGRTNVEITKYDIMGLIRSKISEALEDMA